MVQDARNRPILLVDDSVDEVELTVMAFRTNGIPNEIVVARDGAEAVDLLLPSDDREPLLPSIVLMDINMPRLGGLETLRLLRADPATSTLPVIMLSSSIEDHDVVLSWNLGASGYVQKPVNYDHFVKVAHELGVNWLNLKA